MVDVAWQYNVKTRNQLHKLAYKELRKLYPNVPAILIPTFYSKALGIVKSARSNSGSKPTIKKFFALLHKRMYRLSLENRSISILGLEYQINASSYLEKFKNGWNPKEATLHLRRGKLWMNIVFEKLVKVAKPKAVMGIDLNLKNLAITVLDFKGKVLHQEKLPFKGLVKALTHKIFQEGIQRRYGKSWRFVEGIKKAISRHGFRQHSRCLAEIHLIANRIVGLAEKFQAFLSMENLKGLRIGNDVEKVHLWAYRKQQFVLGYKALLKGLRSLLVSAKGTSSKCPICDRRLRQKTYEGLECPEHGLMDRDLLASWNIAKKGLKLVGKM